MCDYYSSVSVKVLSHPGHGIQVQVESKATGLEDVSLLIQEASSVLTDWHERPGNYTSVGSLTASLIPLRCR